jgi:dipeptidyl aminopeptidase/acylaminoacyl peptidase
MNDLDSDLREMFRRHEPDVGAPSLAPDGLRRRVRRRQAGTILATSLVLGALVIGVIGLRSAVGDRSRPVDSPAPPPQAMTLQGFGVGFSADGNRLLTRSMTDPGGSIYDAHTGELLQTVRGPRNIGGPKNTGLIQAFAPNGELFVSGRGDPATTWVNDATIGTALLRLRGACCLAAFSPDGHFLAAPCCLVGTRVYDIGTGTIVNTFDAGGLMAFSPDSNRLVISVGRDAPGNVVAYVWSIRAETRADPVLTLHGAGGGNIAQASVAWSPDGTMIAVVGGLTRARDVLVFDARTGARIFTIEPARGAVSVAFAPDSGTIAVGENKGRVSLWTATAGPTRVLSFRPHETEVASIAFSPDGTQLMTGAWHENETMVWDIASLSTSPKA